MGAGVGEGVGAGDGDADGDGVGDGAPGAAGEPPHPISIRQAAMCIFAMCRQTGVFVSITGNLAFTTNSLIVVTRDRGKAGLNRPSGTRAGRDVALRVPQRLLDIRESDHHGQRINRRA